MCALGPEDMRLAGDQLEGPPKKKAKLSKTALYKPPTSEEINQLKETENLFQSSLFRMQVQYTLTLQTFTYCQQLV